MKMWLFVIFLASLLGFPINVSADSLASGMLKRAAERILPSSVPLVGFGTIGCLSQFRSETSLESAKICLAPSGNTYYVDGHVMVRDGILIVTKGGSFHKTTYFGDVWGEGGVVAGTGGIAVVNGGIYFRPENSFRYYGAVMAEEHVVVWEGEGQLGSDGSAEIPLEPDFLRVVNPEAQRYKYRVYPVSSGPDSVYVRSVDIFPDRFIVRGKAGADTSFNFIIIATRRGFEMVDEDVETH